LNEASRLFNSYRLKKIIAELGEHANTIHGQQKPRGITQNITLVDGSLVSCLPSLIDASIFKNDSSTHLFKWRQHTAVASIKI
jgi:hypothetical protein